MDVGTMSDELSNLIDQFYLCRRAPHMTSHDVILPLTLVCVLYNLWCTGSNADRAIDGLE
jgi:hypothetical protein